MEQKYRIVYINLKLKRKFDMRCIDKVYKTIKKMESKGQARILIDERRTLEEDKCDQCGLTASLLKDQGIELNAEGICESCCEEIVKEWEQERKDLNKYWEDTRL